MSPRTRRLVALAASLGVAVLVTGMAVAGRGSAESGDAGAPAPEPSAPLATAAPAAPSTTTTTLALPQPAPSPLDAYADVPIVELGTIEIPRIDLVHTVYEGVELTVVDHGPGHWPGSATPGGYGNTVFAGHRVTNSHPFRRIDELEPGDEIVVRTASGGFTYRVTGSDVVTPDALWIVDQAPGFTITLFACHPPGSAAFRYVVRGELVTADPAAGV